MCGLVGVAGSVSLLEEKVFKSLLFLDTLRGEHSTGILSVTRGGDTSILKKAVSAQELAQFKQYDDIFKRNSTLLMGHNRYATKGKINSTNAHPFECGDIIGAHNGTLVDQYLLPDYKDFEVDSENIFHAINKEGVKATCGKLHGAFALTWYDRKDHSLNFLRNDERPLFIAASQDEKTIFWASEDWMIKVACGRAGAKFKNPLSVDKNTHFKYLLPNSEVKGRVSGISLNSSETLEMYVPQYPKIHHRGNFAFNRAKEDSPAGKDSTPHSYEKSLKFLNVEIKFVVDGEVAKEDGSTYFLAHPLANQDISLRIYTQKNSLLYYEMKDFAKTTTVHTGWARCIRSEGRDVYLIVDTSSIKSGHLQPVDEDIEDGIEDGDDDTYEETFTGPNGQELSRAQFMSAVRAGCAWCGDTILPVDAKDVVWLSDGSCVCPDCQELPMVKEYIGLN